MKIMIKIEFMKCKTCGIITLHEIKINTENGKVENIQCYRCKYDEEIYKSLELMHDEGTRFRLGI